MDDKWMAKVDGWMADWIYDQMDRWKAALTSKPPPRHVPIIAATTGLLLSYEPIIKTLRCDTSKYMYDHHTSVSTSAKQLDVSLHQKLFGIYSNIQIH